MKKLILGAVSLTALTLSGTAFAQGLPVPPPAATSVQSASIAVSGVVGNTCLLTAPSAVASANAVIGPDGSVTIPQLADGATAKLQPVAFTIAYKDSYCNYAHQVSIQSSNGGLIDLAAANDPTPTSGAFVRRVGYSSAIKWSGSVFEPGPKVLTSTTTDLGDDAAKKIIVYGVGGANRDDLQITLKVDTATSSDPVVAGTYTERLNVVLGPKA